MDINGPRAKAAILLAKCLEVATSGFNLIRKAFGRGVVKAGNLGRFIGSGVQRSFKRLMDFTITRSRVLKKEVSQDPKTGVSEAGIPLNTGNTPEANVTYKRIDEKSGQPEPKEEEKTQSEVSEAPSLLVADKDENTKS